MIENKQILPNPNEKGITGDLDNFLCADKNSKGKCKIENIELLEVTLRELGYNKIVLIVSSYFFKRVDNPLKYEKLGREKRIIKAPALEDTDWYVLQLARELDYDIFSNDKFKDYWDEFGEGWIKEKRKTFMLFNGKLIIKRWLTRKKE